MSDHKHNSFPNFFILGAAKAGTTSLHGMLTQHPEIFMTRNKETQFFFNDNEYALGINHYLTTNFSGAWRYPVRGEASPSYFHAPERVAPRLLDSPGRDEMKFVVVLRDPVQRAWSHYLHRVRLCAEPCTFEDAIACEEKRLRNDPHLWVGYYRDGLYGKLLNEWFEYFPRDRFVIVRYESMVSEWQAMLNNIATHLGVSADYSWNKLEEKNVAGVPRSKWLMRFLADIPAPLKNAGKLFLGRDQIVHYRELVRRLNTKRSAKPALNPEVERMLRGRYEEDITTLERLLGADFSAWKL